MRTVDAVPEFVPALLERMDPAELALLSKLTTGRGADCLIGNIRNSTLTWCGLDDDGVVTMGGVMPVAAGQTGYFWQVVTPALVHHKRDYILQGRMMVARALAQFERLTTNIRADYTAALRHTKRFGFKVSEPRLLAGAMICVCERTR